jgi:hypothetical protein
MYAESHQIGSVLKSLKSLCMFGSMLLRPLTISSSRTLRLYRQRALGLQFLSVFARGLRYVGVHLRENSMIPMKVKDSVGIGYASLPGRE